MPGLPARSAAVRAACFPRQSVSFAGALICMRTCASSSARIRLPPARASACTQARLRPNFGPSHGLDARRRPPNSRSAPKDPNFEKPDFERPNLCEAQIFSQPLSWPRPHIDRQRILIGADIVRIFDHQQGHLIDGADAAQIHIATALECACQLVTLAIGEDAVGAQW